VVTVGPYPLGVMTPHAVFGSGLRSPVVCSVDCCVQGVSAVAEDAWVSSGR